MPAEHHRKGDERADKRGPKVSLTFLPAHNQPFRWLPKHGEPLCIGEWMSQHLVRAVAWAPLYTAVIVTLTLLVMVFGVPFVDD